MLRLYTKVAVLTGGTTALTTTVAQRFLDEGAAVAMLGRDPDGLQLAGDLGDRAVYLPCDVCRDDEVSRALDAVVEQFGRIDILVNSGVATDDRASGRRCIEHVICHLRATGAGSIINISAVQGQARGEDVPAWASRSSVGRTTPVDAFTYAPDNIRVNDICPGFISTGVTRDHVEQTAVVDGGAGRSLDALHPLRGTGTLDDIAWAAVFLASSEARWITGAALAIDGGYSAGLSPLPVTKAPRRPAPPGDRRPSITGRA